MAKEIDEQESNVLPLNFSELTEQAEEEGELEDLDEQEAEELLTPEEVLAAFRILANTIDETCESGPDWAPWYYWTEGQARKLLDYVDCIAWHTENVKTALALIGIKFDYEN